ncbi:hypothetical protein CDAR_622161 [Caerostris darwini]|uniref:Uncharacterized protein n=1 Tax=Caerostris darwini TaxID=1538125 RepID=A0AAV4QD98_9ARAC|nr:hypothetical protein CDAR_622161 [Caerostris darwini]
MTDEKIENFVKCLFTELYQTYIMVNELDVSVSIEDKEDDVQIFLSVILDFFNDFENGILANLHKVPVLFFSSENIFSEFVYSICYKLVQGQPFYPLFAISTFMLNIATLSMDIECYRLVYLLPGIFLKVFNDMLKTGFFACGGFENLKALSLYLKYDEEVRNKTIQELKALIESAISNEICVLQKKAPGVSHFIVKKVNSLRGILTSSDSNQNERCLFCNSCCFVNLKIFFQPSIKYKYNN